MQRIYLKSGDTLELNSKIYTVKSVIGDGATCVVYSAEYKDNKGYPHRVNIKECYPYNASISREDTILKWELDDEKEKHLKSFDTTYKKLNVWQEGISNVSVYDICDANNTKYIIMEHNKGCVTFDKDNPETLSDILKTVKLLAHYVETYHQNGYLHLDIKPSNFLIYPRPSEHIVLFDLDTVTAISDIETGKCGYASYSDGWAAPEQKQGKINKLCPATDIYAIGAVLFEKILGRQVDNDDVGYFAEWSFDNELFEDVNPKIKRLLTNIFKKTLAASIKRRYQSADALIKDLDKAIKIADSKIYLKGDDICCSGYFVGREEELKKIKDSFDSKKKAVFLHGFGGIGKTEIARKFAELYKKEYDVVLFVKYDSNSSLQEKIDEIEIINFEGDSAEHRKKLRSLLDDKTLVIIDNFDVEIGVDNGLKSLFDTKAHVLISTRTDFSSVYSGDKYTQIEITELASNELEQVFLSNAKIDCLKESDKNILYKVFKLIENHTYATELLAKQMYYSGWSIETLYSKIRSGFASLECVEKIVTNKDDDTKKDNTLNILRAVYCISDLTEGQKQVLRNIALLDFVKINKDSYGELIKYDISLFVNNTDNSAIKTQLDFRNDFNTLVEIGLLKIEEGFYVLHRLVHELIWIELQPNEINCPNVYFYILSIIEWFEESDDYEDASQAEAENNAIFLLHFFETIDFNNIVNLKLVLRWLNSVFESSFYFTDSQYTDSKLVKLYDRLSKINNIDDAYVSYNLYSILFIGWLHRTTFCFVVETPDEHNELELCENNTLKFFSLAISFANTIDGCENGKHTYELGDVVIDSIKKTASQRMLIRDLCGNKVTSDIDVKLVTRIPKRIIHKIYDTMPEKFTDIHAWDKQYFDLPLSKEEKDYLSNEYTASFEEYNDDVDYEWIALCDKILQDFKDAKNKLEFLNDLLENKKYTPSQKVSLLNDILELAFGNIIWGRNKKDMKKTREFFKSTDWAFWGEIVNLLCLVATSNEDYNWIDADLEYLSRIPVYRAILSAIFELDDFSYWISVIFENAKTEETLLSVDNTYDFCVEISQVDNACEIMQKSRYILPFLAKEVVKILSDIDETSFEDEVKKYYHMIMCTAHCAENAIAELESINNTDSILELIANSIIDVSSNDNFDKITIIKDFYYKIYAQMTVLIDNITNKKFDLKPDTE